MIQIIIGRESPSNRLLLKIGDRTEQYGSIGSVPKSVSKQHCLLTIDNTDENQQMMSITNSNIKNVTFVNGLQIESCRVSENDVVELGANHYTLDMKAIMDIIQKINPDKEVDIRKLENVWKNYKLQLEHLQKSQTLTNVLRSGIPILTIGTGVIGFFINKEGNESSLQVKIVMIITLIIFIVLWIKSLIDTQQLPKKREELNKQMLKKYCCPKCNYFFGYQPYDIIKSNLDICPKCKNKLKK